MTDQTERRAALGRLYVLLDRLGEATGGTRRLGDCTGRMGWPEKGVYLFFEEGELREGGLTPRVVRVGTHALTETSKTSLWDRLRTHRGTNSGWNPGGGNHRGSVFRLHVGTALISRDDWTQGASTWGHDSSASRAVREEEAALERAVSEHLRSMELLWVSVPHRDERRALERGLIRLLSNADRAPIDSASNTWLGYHADREGIRRSGLWNVDHVGSAGDTSVVDLLEARVAQHS